MIRFRSLYMGAAAGVLVATLSAAPAISSTTTTTIAVSATSLSSCVVAATPLAFGSYSAATSSPNDATSTVTATCTSGTPYTLALDAGTTSGSTIAARGMTNGTDTMHYNLYTTSARSTVWGDGTSSTVTQGATSAGLPAVYTVYGRVPANQYVSTGAYSDLVTVTLTY